MTSPNPVFWTTRGWAEAIAALPAGGAELIGPLSSIIESDRYLIAIYCAL